MTFVITKIPTWISDLLSNKPIKKDLITLKIDDIDIHVISKEDTKIIRPNFFGFEFVATYCPYDKCIYICTGRDMMQELEIWTMIDNSWKLKCVSRHYFRADVNTAGIKKVTKIISSRTYLFLETIDKYDANVIVVMTKDNIIEIKRIHGCHPIYYDYYDDWFEEIMEFLKSVKDLKKLSTELLKIVLSYVA